MQSRVSSIACKVCVCVRKRNEQTSQNTACFVTSAERRGSTWQTVMCLQSVRVANGALQGCTSTAWGVVGCTKGTTCARCEVKKCGGRPECPCVPRGRICVCLRTCRKTCLRGCAEEIHVPLSVGVPLTHIRASRLIAASSSLPAQTPLPLQLPLAPGSTGGWMGLPSAPQAATLTWESTDFCSAVFQAK